MDLGPERPREAWLSVERTRLDRHGTPRHGLGSALGRRRLSANHAGSVTIKPKAPAETARTGKRALAIRSGPERSVAAPAARSCAQPALPRSLASTARN